jgi:hypothetical protein
MSLIWEQGFNVKRGKEEAYQKWITENDAAYKSSAPPGVEFLGTYIVTMTSEKHTGEYRQLFRIESFASVDTMVELARDQKSVWGRLSREETEFWDLPIGAEFSFGIYRPLTEAAVWNIS